MLKRSIILVSMILLSTSSALAQDANSAPQNTNDTNRSTRKRTVETPQTEVPSQGNRAAGRASKPPAGSVLAAFNALLDGIRHADVEAVTNAYWNSPRLVLFNNNGTVTKGWEQMRENRASSYRDLKDVKLDVHDLRVTMLGRDAAGHDAALITCLWTQSQTSRGVPESASGRMTIILRRYGGEWKAVHLHTSPDAPNPERVMPSERAPTPTPKATP
jgi:ketosteroid isomerase-like protein